ncbi:hypothetical protein DFH11DRAFT_275638 [Phellopilus nigrolimitatus]|nr:hypothetical protein DFH11DRAFT_275638 [Phellopilus nigrolimitatus]
MSQAPDSSNSNFTSQYVHLKEIEIVFKAKRPQRQMSLKLQADGDPRKSARFGKDEAVHWKDHLHVLSSAELIVSVYQYQASLRKTLFAEVSIKAADIAGKQSFSVEDSEGKVFVKLSCISVAPTEEFVELLIEEADHQLGNKKVLLDNLGKASRAVALLMDFGNQIADLHPAAKAAITIVNVLYERCKMQKELSHLIL